MEPLRQLNEGERVRIQLPADVPFDKKWDILKPAIKQLYIDENKKLAQVMEIVGAEYGFVAAEAQYKYHIKKWKLKKNISTPKKEAMCEMRKTRAEAGKSSSFRDVRQGKDVDEKKLRRHLKQAMRRDVALRHTSDEGAKELRILSGSSFLLSNSIFLNWNMPYGTMQSSRIRGPSYAAASPTSISTPSDIAVNTPPTNNAFSPNNAPSPLTRIQNMRVTTDRAHMFVEGRHGALVKSMHREEKEIMSTWLYQFWFYGFKSAKCWGNGPRDWDAQSLRLDAFKAISPTPLANTPRTDNGSIYDQPNRPNHRERNKSNVVDSIPKPSSLCRWSIHYYSNVKYEPCQSRIPTPEPNADPLDEESWRPWPESWKELPYQKRLLNNLASNDFSNIKSETLPMAVPRIVEALEGSDNELLEEAVGFSIIARNRDLLSDLYDNWILLPDDKRETGEDEIRKLNPLHLATTYISGSKTCCTIVDTLLSGDHWDLYFRTSNANNLGHTVFDNLLIAILKAHTSITPGAVNDALRDETRFPGEEVDICGRWDADSDCVQALFNVGIPSIPFAWKHKFCHTSAQAICHCINSISNYISRTNDLSVFDIPSGLFLKRCVSCGLKMQLDPLHSIVLTTFELAQRGTRDEDLFGMLAVLLCILQLGANPLLTVDLSVSALFFSEYNNTSGLIGCVHEQLRPAELADRVPLDIVNNWSECTKIGWKIFCHILHLSEKEWQTNDLPLTDSCNHAYRKTNNFFGKSKTLGTLCAAVQAELLTYRRLRDGDPWVSPNFDMHALLQGLVNRDCISVDLVEKEMMKPTCGCGRFADNYHYPRAEQAARYHFSNLEDWNRTTFLTY